MKLKITNQNIKIIVHLIKTCLKSYANYGAIQGME